MQKSVLCPFYRFDDGHSLIRCEGVMLRSTVSQRYRRKADWTRFVRDHCCRDYQSCPLYAEIGRKYNAQDEK